MEETALRYGRWKAPPEDGGMLIWPEPAVLLSQTLQNHARLSAAHDVFIQNVPLAEVRGKFRQWLGHAEDDLPLIATGHQAELYHPGVWAKNALIGVVADKLAGQAYHFAVDTDAPKHLNFRWPGGSMALADHPTESAAWSALLPAPSPAHLATLSRALENASAHWSFEPLAGAFLASMRRLALESPPLPDSLANAAHELDWKLGLRHHLLLVSPLLASEPYLVFVHHILARASAFSADYNAALAAFRVENKIRSPGRPMPNMTCHPDGCEVPFWLDDLESQTRSRAAVVCDGDAFALRRHNDRFHFDPRAQGWEAARKLSEWLLQRRLRLSPRALTLTAVLRLLAADQFVHGIGGGQYDQVLDGLIARHLRIEPPHFSVTTATLYFPDAVGKERICLPCMIQEGHRLRHAALAEEKMPLVENIASLPRRSPERESLFFEMRHKLAEAGGTALKVWEQQFEQARQLSREQRALFDRELFYAIQPTGRLIELIGHYRDAFA